MNILTENKETPTFVLPLSKLATLKRITFAQAKAFAAEKGAKLTRESEIRFYKGGRRTNVITDSWYELSTAPDKKFSYLTEVQDFLSAPERADIHDQVGYDS